LLLLFANCDLVLGLRESALVAGIFAFAGAVWPRSLLAGLGAPESTIVVFVFFCAEGEQEEKEEETREGAARENEGSHALEGITRRGRSRGGSAT